MQCDVASRDGSGLTEGLGPLPAAEWLAGDGSQAWRAATVLSWPTLNAKRYTTPLFTGEQLRAAFEAGRLAERNRCRYPDCVENEDERCPRWLTGECEGPNVLVTGDQRP
jgi:hypothetical protein